ncbi:MAG: hypothetical protein LBE48_02075 [Methanomassiliicoccaceae archaeon]|jgi:hypothetical protein|nr:hypothetical protein [Methanomassiliicoccaceae archaeon]
MKEKFIKRTAHVSNLSLIRRGDKVIIYLFIALLIASAAAMIALVITETVDAGTALMLISVPFLIVGLVTYLRERMWKALIIALIVPAALFWVGIELMLLFFVAFLMVGCVGVVSVAAVIQRKVFFFVISSIEYFNVKDKPTLWEKLVAFLFNIPPNIDTRRITMDYNMKRTGIPFKEMMETMSFAFMVGIALWIYMSLNPAFINEGFDMTKAPIFVFSLVMFIPLLVLPWTPFKSLNVRITTNYRDFSIYKGGMATIRRMAVPVLAVFIFLVLAANKTDPFVVVGFIASSVVFNMLVVAASSIFFYLFFERTFVEDAVAKWRIFRPVPIMLELGDTAETETKDQPGTPERDLSDIGDVEITSQR